MKNATITGLLILLANPSLAEAQDFSKELAAIAMTESSGGKYTNHALMESGIHKGTRAGGAYGMMPSTVLMTLKWSRRLRDKYPELLTMTPSEITQKLNSDRKLATDLALTHWKRMRVYMNFTRERAAYCWLNGWGGQESVARPTILAHWYVQRFLRYLEPRLAYVDAPSR